MGCGCSKRKSSTKLRTKIVKSPTKNNASPSELRAIGVRQAVSIKSSQRLDSDQRRIAKLRRDKIRKKLNKG